MDLTQESGMTLRVDVEDGATRWSEIVAGGEAGRDVAVATGPVLVATEKGERFSEPTRQDSIDAIPELRQRMPRATADEAPAWRDEGRR